MTRTLRDDLLNGRAVGRYYVNHQCRCSEGIYRLLDIRRDVNPQTGFIDDVIDYKLYDSDGEEDEFLMDDPFLHEHLDDPRAPRGFKPKD